MPASKTPKGLTAAADAATLVKQQLRKYAHARLLTAVLLSAPGHVVAATATPSDAASAAAAEAEAELANPMHCDVRPEYPVDPAKHGVEGTTTIDITFDTDGAFVTSRVVKPSGTLADHALLDQAALATVAHCRLTHADARPTTRQVVYRWIVDSDVRKANEFQTLRAAQAAKVLADAKHGDPTAQIQLAKNYAYGDGVARDDELATQWFRRAAEAGDADGQVYYGQRLMAGKGAPQDDAAGIAWLRKAVDQGSGSAAYGLGIFARAGRGMPASDTEAFRWFLQGALAGSNAAMVETAKAYAQGIGTTRDDAQAVRWYLATSSRNMWSVYQLGLAYRDGLGVPVDYQRAAFCMAVAAWRGEKKANAALETIAKHLDAATMALIQARADAWHIGEPLFK